jgi:DNA-binding response OmpR family regulator
MQRVLIIGGEESRLEMATGLRDAGYGVEEEEESSGGLRRAMEAPHSVVIMSEEMPGVGGKELLEALQGVTKGPIVVVGSGGETAMVGALLQGADAYLEQPVSVQELVARVRALVRRCQGREEEDGHLLGMVMDGVVGGKVFEKLSRTEARLLQYLWERAGHLTLREELVTGVWGEAGKDTSLRFYIWQLRRKLKEAGRIEILNLKGMGYLLRVHPLNSQ